MHINFIEKFQSNLIIIFLFFIFGSVNAQNDCAAYPKTGKFDSLTYIKTEIPTDPSKGKGIWLGQGVILRNGVELRPAFIPSNHPTWAIAIAVAWNYSRNIINRVNYPQIGYWLATCVQETELGCVTGTTWDSAYKVSPNMANATIIMNQNGCFQIEGPGSAYGQLNQNYPLGRFPLSLYPALMTGPNNFETSALVKTYFDVYTTLVYNNQIGWNVYKSIDCTKDPLAYIKTAASGYNGGINAFASNAGFYNGSQNNNNCWSGLAATTAGYAEDVAKWVSVLENMTSYCAYPTGSTFDCYYNGNITLAMLDDYLDMIAIMYPEVNMNTVKTKVQTAFNSLATGGVIPFEQLGPVIDEIVLSLPMDYPQTVEGSPTGLNIYSCSGNKVPYGHFELLNGSTKLCLGQSVTLNLAVDAGGGDSPTFKWFKQSDPGNILATTQSLTITPTAAGTEVYAAEICNTNGCFQLNCNTENTCMDPRNICGIEIEADSCSGCNFIAVASSVNTPCKGMPKGIINLTLTNTPANYNVSYTGTTSLGNVSGSFNSSGNTVSINNLRDGSYNIVLQNLNNPVCKAYTNVIVSYTTPINEYVDGEMLSKSNCIADIEATIKELPAPCEWKVRVYVPVYFMWEDDVNFGVTTSTGISYLDRYTRIAPKPEMDQWNDVQVFEAYFDLNTGDSMTFKFALTDTPGASMLRDYQIDVFDANNNDVYTQLVKAGSAHGDQPYTAGSYKVTCPQNFPDYTFTWSPDLSNITNTNTTSQGNAKVLGINSNYVVTAINASNPQCILTDTILIPADAACKIVCTPPSVTVSSNTPCEGATLNLNSNATLHGGATSSSYNWSGPAGTLFTTQNPSINSVSMSMAGNYTVTVSDNQGCSQTAGVTVTVNGLPTVNAGNDQKICAGASIILSATGGLDYQWNNGITQGAAITPSSTTTYAVTVTGINTCSAAKSILVTVNPLPIANPGNDKNVCAGTSVILSATGGINYQWNNGATEGASFIPVNTRTYTVTVTDINNCSAKDSLIITVNPLPTPEAGNLMQVCRLMTIQPAPITDATWSCKWTTTSAGTIDNQNTCIPDFGIVNPQNLTKDTSVKFILEVTDANGCKGKDSMNVIFEFNCKPNVLINVNPASICIGQSAVVSASVISYNGIKSYQWNEPSFNTMTVPFIVNPTTTVTYILLVTDNNDKIGGDTVIVRINQLPVVEAGLNVSICLGRDTTLTANPAGMKNYLWSNNNNSRQTLVNPVVTTTYFITVTDNNNCSNKDSVVVTVNPLPTLTFGALPDICKDASPIMLSNGYCDPTGGTFSGQGVSENSFNPSDANIGADTITYTYTDLVSKCTNSITNKINVLSIPPTANVTMATVCSMENNNIKLEITNYIPGYIYEWYDAPAGGTLIETDSIFLKNNVTSADTVYVEVEMNNQTCKSSSRGMGIIRIGVVPTAQFTYQPNIISENVNVNFNNLSTSNIPSDNLLYYWWFGQNEGSSTQKNPTYTYIDSGKYLVKLQVYNDDGCNDTKVDTINVTKLLNIWLPTAFSPNGDFNNDYFYVRGPVQSMRIEIFNQWGIKVFESNEQVKGWDGKYKGQDQPEGNYLWNLDAETYDGRYFKLQGVVLLYR